MQIYQVIIEIPKNSDRRIHLSFDRSKFVDLGSISHQIPINAGKMPVNYGFFPNTSSAEGDELDVIVISENTFITSERVEVTPIALMERADQDHKIIAIDQTINAQKWDDLDPKLKKTILDFFSFHHSVEIKPAENVIKLINNSQTLEQYTYPISNL